MQYRLTNTSYDSGWLEGATGAAALRDALTASQDASLVPQTLMLRHDGLAADQFRNFVALIVKSWRHMSFGSIPPSNPWSGYRDRALVEIDLARVLPGTITYDAGTWTFTLSATAVSAAATLLRLINMLKWSVLYSDRVKLTSSTAFKTSTFEDISKHCRLGVTLPVRTPAPAPDAETNGHAAGASLHDASHEEE